MKVSIVCISDRPERLPLLYWSLVAQTHKDWELIVLDQLGSYTGTVGDNVPWMDDERVHLHSVHRYDDWGQTAKEYMAMQPEFVTGEALMFPADDAYYVPIALEIMVRHIESGHNLVLCSWLYDQMGYTVMPPRLAKGYLDVGGMMIRAETFRKVGWNDKSQTGDYTLAYQIASLDYTKVASELRTLYVKN